MMPSQVRESCQLERSKPLIWIDFFFFFNSYDLTAYSRLSTLNCSPSAASAVEEMVKEIQDVEGLQALRLEGNTIGVEAAQAIAKALENKGELKV